MYYNTFNACNISFASIKKDKKQNVLKTINKFLYQGDGFVILDEFVNGF